MEGQIFKPQKWEIEKIGKGIFGWTMWSYKIILSLSQLFFYNNDSHKLKWLLRYNGYWDILFVLIYFCQLDS